MFHVVHCADVSADHIILGVLSRGEIVDGNFRQLERLVRAQLPYLININFFV
jgi:hypothetical protein